MISPYLVETLPDLGIDDDEFDQLDHIVQDKKIKPQTDNRSGCQKGFLCRLFRTYDTHFLLSLGL